MLPALFLRTMSMAGAEFRHRHWGEVPALTGWTVLLRFRRELLLLHRRRRLFLLLLLLLLRLLLVMKKATW